MKTSLCAVACALAVLVSSAYAQEPPDDTGQLQGLIDNATQNPQNGRYEVTIPASPDPVIWRPWSTGPIDALFKELKARLDQIPNREQRARAAQFRTERAKASARSLLES